MAHNVVHGTVYRYRKGCRCAECTAAKTQAHREYVANVKARTGISPTQKIRGVVEAIPCASCGKGIHRTSMAEPMCNPCRRGLKRSLYIHPRQRAAIYERDGWVCQICSEAVEPGLPSSSAWQATLDHIVPRSKGGSDLPANLRLAHRYCNAVRSNRVELTLEELVA